MKGRHTIIVQNDRQRTFFTMTGGMTECKSAFWLRRICTLSLSEMIHPRQSTVFTMTPAATFSLNNQPTLSIGFDFSHLNSSQGKSLRRSIISAARYPAWALLARDYLAVMASLVSSKLSLLDLEVDDMSEAPQDGGKAIFGDSLFNFGWTPLSLFLATKPRLKPKPAGKSLRGGTGKFEAAGNFTEDNFLKYVTIRGELAGLWGTVDSFEESLSVDRSTSTQVKFALYKGMGQTLTAKSKKGYGLTGQTSRINIWYHFLLLVCALAANAAINIPAATTRMNT
ncbi:hypothetical protein BDP27DRAFT_1363382 [Rhodocollybia butyracea]|uniref:Uncharacterized protein n=1 Tax=Rhodocollybia butyracea TaxID=206335 RepID=A0A9P5PNW7_9AGAR|nr:hypothetical protein BDP27DRAFT_1363382 [Rhodocollybia butyracea]